MKTNWVLVVAFATAVIGLFQAFQARRSFVADHERRRKQATLDAWDTARSRCETELALLGAAYKDSPTLNEQDARLLHEGVGPMRERRAALQKYLNCLERVAVGARLGIYDLDVLDEVGRGSIVGARDRFRSFVALARRDQSDRLYEAQWWLADQLEQRARPADSKPKGRIRKS